MNNKHVFGLLSFGLALSLILTGCFSTDALEVGASVEEQRTAVEVQEMKRSTIKNELTYIGQVQPQKQISVASKLAAEVKEVFFDIGDTVQAGDVLFTVDAKDIEDQIRTLQVAAEQTQLAIEQAEYGLQIAQEGSAQERLTEIGYETQINAARSGARSSDHTRESLKDARDMADDALDAASSYRSAEVAAFNAMKSHLTELQIELSNAQTAGDTALEAALEAEIYIQEYEIVLQEAAVADATRAVASAESAYQQAKNSYAAARTTADGADMSLEYSRESYEAYREVAEETKERSIQQAEFGVQTAQAAANSTQVQLSIVQSTLGYAQVSTPISGVISARSIEVGQMISQATLPFTIIEMDTVNIQVDVSETLINTIFPGNQVEVMIQALGGETFTGTVTAVSPAASATSTYPIRVELPNEDGRIKPGMFAQVTFVEDQRDNTFVVDKNVVLSDETSQYVYVIRDGSARKVTVTTGISSGTTIEILSGLSVGDQIAVVGQEYLEEGTLVNIVKLDGETVPNSANGSTAPAAATPEDEESRLPAPPMAQDPDEDQGDELSGEVEEEDSQPVDGYQIPGEELEEE